MPGPEQIIRTAVALPLTIARRVIGLGLGLLPGSGHREAPTETLRHDDARGHEDAESDAAAREALAREREPREEAIFTPDADFFDDDDRADDEVALVAESHDAEAIEPPGAQLHVDEPWDGYRRMKVAEITARLEGQSPEVLAAVELYEMTHRKRRGVLDAVRSASRP